MSQFLGSFSALFSQLVGLGVGLGQNPLGCLFGVLVWGGSRSGGVWGWLFGGVGCLGLGRSSGSRPLVCSNPCCPVPLSLGVVLGLGALGVFAAASSAKLLCRMARRCSPGRRGSLRPRGLGVRFRWCRVRWGLGRGRAFFSNPGPGLRMFPYSATPLGRFPRHFSLWDLVRAAVAGGFRQPSRWAAFGFLQAGGGVVRVGVPQPGGWSLWVGGLRGGSGWALRLGMLRALVPLGWVAFSAGFRLRLPLGGVLGGGGGAWGVWGCRSRIRRWLVAGRLRCAFRAASSKVGVVRGRVALALPRLTRAFTVAWWGVGLGVPGGVVWVWPAGGGVGRLGGVLSGRVCVRSPPSHLRLLGSRCRLGSGWGWLIFPMSSFCHVHLKVIKKWVR